MSMVGRDFGAAPIVLLALLLFNPLGAGCAARAASSRPPPVSSAGPADVSLEEPPSGNLAEPLAEDLVLEEEPRQADPDPWFDRVDPDDPNLPTAASDFRGDPAPAVAADPEPGGAGSPENTTGEDGGPETLDDQESWGEPVLRVLRPMGRPFRWFWGLFASRTHPDPFFTPEEREHFNAVYHLKQQQQLRERYIRGPRRVFPFYDQRSEYEWEIPRFRGTGIEASASVPFSTVDRDEERAVLEGEAPRPDAEAIKIPRDVLQRDFRRGRDVLRSPGIDTIAIEARSPDSGERHRLDVVVDRTLHRHPPTFVFEGPTVVDTTGLDAVTWKIRSTAKTDWANVSVVTSSDAVEVSRKAGQRVQITAREPSDLRGLDQLRLRAFEGTWPAAANGAGKFGERYVDIVNPPLTKYAISGPTELDASPNAEYVWRVRKQGGRSLEHQADIEHEWEATDEGYKFTVQGEKIVGREFFELEVWESGAPKERQMKVDKAGSLRVRVRNYRRPPRLRTKFQIQDRQIAAKHFGESFAKSFYAIEVTIHNEYPRPVRVSASSIRLPVNYIARETFFREATKGFAGNKPAEILERAGETSVLVPFKNDVFVVWQAERTPMNFGAIINTLAFDRRNDGRQVFIELLRVSGAIAAGATGFGGVGESYSKVLNWVQGPITEGLAKLLLKDLKEHLPYMNEAAMHDDLLIGARSSVSKYVFFPRGDIPGVWGAGLPVRVINVAELQGEEAEGSITGMLIEASSNVSGDVSAAPGDAEESSNGAAAEGGAAEEAGVSQPEV